MADTYKTYYAGLTTISDTTIYPGLSGYALLNNLTICNKSSSGATFNVWMTHDGVNYSICKNESLTGYAHAQIVNKTIVINQNDTIGVSGSTSNAFDIILSVMEVT